MVDVSSQNNSVSVNVSTGGTSASIKATPDMAQYYSEKSREWAVSNRIVENIDYSSKYYAEKSKESATSALSSAEQAKNVKEQAIEEINSLKDAATNEIQDVAINATSDVTDVKIEALSNIQTSTYEAIEQIEQEGLEQFNKVKSTGFYMRDDKLYFINSKGEEEEFKSGGDSSESGAGMPVGTFFTLNCKDNYVPENCLVRDGTEYSKWQFENFWNDYLTGETSYVTNKKLICPETAIIDNGILSNVQDVYYDENVTTGKEVVIKYINVDTSVTQYLFPFDKTYYISIIDNILGVAKLNDTQLMADRSAIRLTQSDFYIKIISLPTSSDWYNWEIYLSYDGLSYDFLMYCGVGSDKIDEFLKLKLYQCSGQIDLKNSYLKNANETSYFSQQKIESVLNTCSYAEYENELKTYGFCNKFAVNNIGETFRVPTAKKIERYLIDKKEATETDSTWYNLYSDGWCEQGGELLSVLQNDDMVVYLSKPYVNLNYSVLITATGGARSNGQYMNCNAVKTKYLDRFYMQTNDYTFGRIWEACGYIDISAYEVPKEFVVVSSGQINENQYNWNDLVNGLNKVFDDTKINTPFFYGMSQYFENKPNNLSWLKGGQYYTKIVHTGYYNWLLNIYNGVEQNDKVSVKAHTDTTITDYDFVINFENETFRLPLKNGSENLPNAVFEEMTLGATDTSYIAQSNGWVCVCKVAKATGQYIQIVAPSGTEPSKATSSSEWLYATKEVKRGDKYKIQYTATGETKFFRFNHAVGNGDLYYFVGETVSNTNLINAGRIEEQISNLITIVDSYENSYSWYIIYSNGFCRQGGYSTSTSATTTINLLKPYKDSYYTVNVTWAYTSNIGTYSPLVDTTSKNKFTIYHADGGAQKCAQHWEASGYLY